MKTAIFQVMYWLRPQSAMPCEDSQSSKATRPRVAAVWVATPCPPLPRAIIPSHNRRPLSWRLLLSPTISELSNRKMEGWVARETETLG